MVGFATGHIIWMDPVIGKYNRMNKGVSRDGSLESWTLPS